MVTNRLKARRHSGNGGFLRQVLRVLLGGEKRDAVAGGGGGGELGYRRVLLPATGGGGVLRKRNVCGGSWWRRAAVAAVAAGGAHGARWGGAGGVGECALIRCSKLGWSMSLNVKSNLLALVFPLFINTMFKTAR